MICGMTYFQICLYFLVYSFGGWVVEVIFHAVTLGKVINRGFLNGPVCPVYGFGVLSVFAMLNTLQSGGHQMGDGMIFIFGIVLATAVELVAGWLLDVCFHARWWDYSDKKFNINGRVCLIGAIVFGLFCVLLIKVINPVVTGYISVIPKLALDIAVIFFLIGYAIDNIITFSAVAKLDDKLRELKEVLEEKRESVAKTVSSYKEEAIEKIKSYMPETPIYKALTKALSMQNKRIIKAFPRLKSTRYNEALAELREFINRKR